MVPKRTLISTTVINLDRSCTDFQLSIGLSLSVILFCALRISAIGFLWLNAIINDWLFKFVTHQSYTCMCFSCLCSSFSVIRYLRVCYDFTFVSMHNFKLLHKYVVQKSPVHVHTCTPIGHMLYLF